MVGVSLRNKSNRDGKALLESIGSKLGNVGRGPLILGYMLMDGGKQWTIRRGAF